MATNFKSSIINSGLNFKSSTQNSSLNYKRFKNANLFNKKYLFGDGTYSGNIIQGGSVLQPQASYVATIGKITGTAIASYSTLVGGLVANIADGNIGTMVEIRPTLGSTVGIDLGVGARKTIGSFAISQYADTNRGTASVMLQSSSDGAAWVDVQSYSLATNTTSLQSFSLSTPCTARAFRLRSTATNGNNYWEVNEVRFFECAVLENCVVITGAATVAPDATTNAAVFTAQNVVIDGGTLTASVACKGLYGFVSEKMYLLNGGKAHMNEKGFPGNFGAVALTDLLPTALLKKLKKSAYAPFVFPARGAEGGAKTTAAPGATGGAASLPLQTGGGGSGCAWNSATYNNTAPGGCGGPFCGGAGSGGSLTGGEGGGQLAAPGDYGGPGGPGYGSAGVYGGTGGAGAPPGNSHNSTATTGRPAGVILFFCPLIYIAAGCSITANGGVAAGGGNSYVAPGGSAGGGVVGIGTTPGGLLNYGTLQAAGGAAVAATGTSSNGGAGGAGSVNTFIIG